MWRLKIILWRGRSNMNWEEKFYLQLEKTKMLEETIAKQDKDYKIVVNQLKKMTDIVYKLTKE